MLDELGARPWRVRQLGRQLAELYLQLRAVPPPDELPGAEPRKLLVHDDLHPANVILGPGGSVVIDWEGAEAGASDRDAADRRGVQSRIARSAVERRNLRSVDIGRPGPATGTAHTPVFGLECGQPPGPPRAADHPHL